ncbi:daunorubicin ABC transporter ATP-binding protein, partial [Chloroflexota bacterium]
IDQGRIVVEGTPNDLIDQMGSDTISILGHGDRDDFLKKVKVIECVQSVNYGEEIIQIGVDSGNRRLSDVVILANETGFDVDEISVAKPSLGDVFLKYTGRHLRDR